MRIIKIIEALKNHFTEKASYYFILSIGLLVFLLSHLSIRLLDKCDCEAYIHQYFYDDCMHEHADPEDPTNSGDTGDLKEDELTLVDY